MKHIKRFNEKSDDIKVGDKFGFINPKNKSTQI
jgi:hypothetical protein